MSSRRKLRPTNPASMMIRANDGARILGGCDHCDAYQVVHADYYGPDLHRLAIHHDEWCPSFTARKARQQ
jgi:hypothetical protein